jgi:Concanavalin A-like lectin/glucanases superfamily
LRFQLIALLSAMVSTTAIADGPAIPSTFLTFNGTDAVVAVPSLPTLDFGAGGLTIAVWMRPDTLTFAKTEGSLPSQQYVHWLGKGQSGAQAWTFRMYSLTQPGPRENRISFYVFKPEGGRGCGSYFQDPIVPGAWMQVVGVVDRAAREVSIYKNGRWRHSDSYASLDAPLQGGTAPLRVGSKDLTSFFRGAIGPLWIWNRPLSAAEIQSLYESNVAPADGLVLHFAMDEGSGSTLHDSVSGHDGAISNAAWGHGQGSIDDSTGRSGGGC